MPLNLKFFIWQCQGTSMLLNLILIALFLMLLGVIPTWPHSKNWGYYPSGGLSLVLLILFVLMLSGRI
jgi:hypothetical protein